MRDGIGGAAARRAARVGCVVALALAGCGHARVAPPACGAGACDDGVACTVDRCEVEGGAAACIHTPDANACPDDGLPCTVAVCVPEAGCVSRPVPDGPLCDGGRGVCDAGRCVPLSWECTEDVVCDDGVDCTADACGPAGCTHTPVAGACDDGVACTADACGPAGCTHTPVAGACDDGVDCTADACGATGCTHTPVAGACDDGVACTADACGATGCTHTPRADGTPCVSGMCKAGRCEPNPPGPGDGCGDVHTLCTAFGMTLPVTGRVCGVIDGAALTLTIETVTVEGLVPGVPAVVTEALGRFGGRSGDRVTLDTSLATSGVVAPVSLVTADPLVFPSASATDAQGAAVPDAGRGTASFIDDGDGTIHVGLDRFVLTLVAYGLATRAVCQPSSDTLSLPR
ncbi:MAG: hypothetical protein KC543_06725 [Myxococcales bacterium]|nr:hypothetical protein [Myxococcales bacterium]